ncbi:MAG: hypothetical protein WDN48_15000 [Pseudolabrys sp.]
MPNAACGWAGARRDRREEQHHRHRGRTQSRGDGAGPPIPGQEQRYTIISARTRRRSRACVPRSLRKRLSTSCSNSRP